MDGTILLADDDRTIRTVLTQALTRAGCKVHATSSLTTLLRWIEEGRGDVVVSDVVMPDGNGLEFLPKIHADRPGMPVIVISAQNTIMTAIQANEAGAFDYLPKPFDLPELMRRVARGLEAARNLPRRGTPAGDVPPDAEAEAEALPLVGRSAPMQALYRLVARTAASDLPVVIVGESGTGKTLIARVLHDHSERRTLPFVRLTPLDAADPDLLRRAVARTRGGTLLIEELCELSLDAQASLVRMIDPDTETRPRLVATTLQTPSSALSEGRLRKDFYFRLDGVALQMPPLRERIEDIALLADHFLLQARRSGATARRLSEAAIEPLSRYVWPGNVRQLENLIRRLALTAAGEEITPEEVAAALADEPRPTPGSGEPVPDEPLSEAVARHLRRYFALHEGMLPPPGLHERILREVEAPLIEIALESTGGNQLRCAELLGINRNTLRKKIRELEISVTRRRKLM